MADTATLELVKELLDDWEEEAVHIEAGVHRHGDATEAARAQQLRECIAELGIFFPDAHLWHAKGVVPAECFDDPTTETTA